MVGTDRPVFKAAAEGPPRQVKVRPFVIDPFAVTNHLSDAERWDWSYVFFSFVDGDAERLERPAAAPWWRKVVGATWRTPSGRGSSIEGLLDHPVVHVSWNDATAFAAWAGGRLPGEAEREYAAKGGLTAARYSWGDDDPGDAAPFRCNIWQGRFPDEDIAADGYAGTAPVDAFAANGYGLHQMVGNVWEWCAEPFRLRSLSRALKVRDQAARAAGERLLKGGSYLCHRAYCHRYRIAARIGSPPDTTSGNMGFRLVFDPPADDPP